MPKRLAITIAGAVSLGSYEAGVLYEVLDAIHQHNVSPETLDHERIEVDVLTGASSGSMTAAIVAHKMLYAANEFRGPYDNPLYNVWVKQIDLAGLMNTVDDGSPESESALRSIFSSNMVERIAAETLTARYTDGEIPAPITHVAAARSISIGMTLTNMNGVDYGYDMHPSGKFVFTRHEDQLTRVVSVEGTDNKETWEEIRDAAVASGAYPLAFRAKEMDRRRSDYPKSNLEPWTDDPSRFTFTDGGVLQNEPLGMAKKLVDAIDHHWHNKSRFFMFVSPHGKNSNADSSFREVNADYFHIMRRLARVLLGQSEFQDWVAAVEMNKEIALLDARAAEVAEKLRSGELKSASLKRTADGLLKILFTQPKNGSARRVAKIGPETLSDARLRIEHQYHEEIEMLGPGTFSAEAFRDTVLAFEKAANLGGRDYMRIYGVAVSEELLAGAELSAFLGFFDERYRVHDYDRGRMVARGVLTDPALSEPGELGPIRYTPTHTNPIDSTLNGLQLSQLPSEEQQMFRDGIKKRVNELVRDLIGFWSYPADVVVIDPVMNAILNHLFRE
ncbi:patatin-like phospholipase family protein [Edaphobacter sp.]|uniref:patatin-like phospholipase family protein n=1 Tax=Edaphobacter sp. TaxID=1934404 RepID=UPI002DBA0129|nr:patatin-like phospholipase family protein [Edaphobacter sp.]HEU5339740.1 patatin-like phospholipase family protein [Edaphobacter sp.]